MVTESPLDIAMKAHRRTLKLTIVSFAFCIVALFVAAVIMSTQFEDGAFFWAMVMMGAVIIALLLSAVFFPYLKEVREHK